MTNDLQPRYNQIMANEENINTAAKNIEDLLKNYKKDLEEIAKNIIKSCERIEKSWSGSWIGYHSNLYFREYGQPGSGERFSVEWGGIHGLNSGWQTKSLEDVWEYIIKHATKKFDTDDADDKLDEIQDAAESLKTLYELNAGGEVLEAKIKAINTTYRMYDFIKARQPGNYMSRGSEAMMQGIKVPPHIQCQAFANALRQNITAAEKLVKLKTLIVNTKEPQVVQMIDDEISHLDPKLIAKVGKLYEDKHYTEAAGVGFRVVKDRLREITSYENGFPAFVDGRLYIKGAAADNVDEDFQEAVKRLLGAIDKFRNEKLHTSEADLKDKNKALSYLHLCSLALSFLSDGSYSIKSKPKTAKPKHNVKN